MCLELATVFKFKVKTILKGAQNGEWMVLLKKSLVFVFPFLWQFISTLVHYTSHSTEATKELEDSAVQQTRFYVWSG